MRTTLAHIIGAASLLAMLFVPLASDAHAGATIAAHMAPAALAPRQASAPAQATPPASRPTGAPAIVPHLNATDPALPTFTEQDVAQYVSTHSGIFRTLVVGTPTIVSIQFISGAQLARVIGESGGIPPDAIVCYVLLHGTFILPGFSGGITVHAIFEAFDGRSGNFLGAGGIGTASHS